MHKSDARPQCEEQENARPMRFDEDYESAFCKVEVLQVEDLSCKILEGEIIEGIIEGEVYEVGLCKVEGIDQVKNDCKEILDLFVEEKSALV